MSTNLTTIESFRALENIINRLLLIFNHLHEAQLSIPVNFKPKDGLFFTISYDTVSVHTALIGKMDDANIMIRSASNSRSNAVAMYLHDKFSCKNNTQYSENTNSGVRGGISIPLNIGFGLAGHCQNVNQAILVYSLWYAEVINDERFQKITTDTKNSYFTQEILEFIKKEMRKNES